MRACWPIEEEWCQYLIDWLSPNDENETIWKLARTWTDVSPRKQGMWNENNTTRGYFQVIAGRVLREIRVLVHIYYEDRFGEWICCPRRSREWRDICAKTPCMTTNLPLGERWEAVPSLSPPSWVEWQNPNHVLLLPFQHKMPIINFNISNCSTTHKVKAGISFSVQSTYVRARYCRS